MQFEESKIEEISKQNVDISVQKVLNTDNNAPRDFLYYDCTSVSFLYLVKYHSLL